MSEIKVDKGIPLPPNFRQTKYPWATMDVGDSFALPGPGQAGRANRLARFATAKYKPKEFVHGKHEGQYRVWRSK